MLKSVQYFGITSWFFPFSKKREKKNDEKVLKFAKNEKKGKNDQKKGRLSPLNGI
jgi:hypothetical protein